MYGTCAEWLVTQNSEQRGNVGFQSFDRKRFQRCFEAGYGFVAGRTARDHLCEERIVVGCYGSTFGIAGLDANAFSSGRAECL